MPHSSPALIDKLNPPILALRGELEQAITALKLSLTADQVVQLLYYLQQLLFWNKAYNLTAIKAEKQALSKHIIDSLSVVPYIHSQNFNNLLDVGTGAGLPAVIVAICCPTLSVTALDSNGKKIRFIKQVVSELGLTHVTPLHCRIEEHETTYSAITSRAFASLVEFVNVVSDKLAVEGQILAMKGVVPSEEIEQLVSQQLAPKWQITTDVLNVPTLDEQRHLIVLKKQ